MDPFECKLAEQVRRYKHLYDPSQRAHRDGRVALKSWRKIASTLQREEAFCRKAWKNTRDRFVKAKKRTRGKGGVNKGVPSILVELEWLSQFVKHRVVDSDFNLEVQYTNIMLPLTSSHSVVVYLCLCSTCVHS